jgi:hypothetical protein
MRLECTTNIATIKFLLAWQFGIYPVSTTSFIPFFCGFRLNLK